MEHGPGGKDREEPQAYMGQEPPRAVLPARPHRQWPGEEEQGGGPDEPRGALPRAVQGGEEPEPAEGAEERGYPRARYY